jgi:hypothetical protein
MNCQTITGSEEDRTGTDFRGDGPLLNTVHRIVVSEREGINQSAHI